MRRLTFGAFALLFMASCTAGFAAGTTGPDGPPPPPPDDRPRHHPHDDAPPPPPPTSSWDQHGWKLLAEAPVPTGRTALRLTFPKDQNPMTKMSIVVIGGEFRMHTTYLAYTNRTGGSISVDQVFHDGERKELPLTANRPLSTFEFKYPPESVKGSPRIEIWGYEGK